MTLLVIFFVISILFSFLCSIWEAVLLSVTPSYVNRHVREGHDIGKRLEKYKQDIDRPLSAILTLNTFAHTAGAIGVGAQASKLFGTIHWDLGFATLTPEALVAGVMTLAILLLSEIIPKTIGANSWKELAPFTVRSLGILMFILAPFVWLSQFITRSLKKDKDKSVLSRADFAAMALYGEESGAIDKSESAIIQNLLELDELVVRDIMTPRPVMIMAEEDTPLEVFFNRHKPLRFSRVPIYKDRSDNITGVLLKDEMLQNLVEQNGDLTIKDIMRPIHIVPDSQPLPKLFETLTRERVHLSIVVDEYGSLVGLVTMEDLVETILGLEIVDEFDAVADLQRLAREKWEERAKRLGLIE